MSYEVVIPARNEEENLKETIIALRNQSISPKKIIVVNDGSKDRTGKIAEKYANEVIHLPDRGYNALGTPEIPKVFNKGLENVSVETDFILICGADAILPPDFFETIYKEMRIDPMLVVASGGLADDSFDENAHPRGTRVVRTDFWREINDLRYPETLGWEDWLLYKALQKGYHIKRIPGLITLAKREPLKTKLKNSMNLGMAMKILGYDWRYAIARSAKFFLNKPKSGIEMFVGYLYVCSEKKLDVANWVSEYQKSKLGITIFNHIKNFLTHN